MKQAETHNPAIYQVLLRTKEGPAEALNLMHFSFIINAESVDNILGL